MAFVHSLYMSRNEADVPGALNDLAGLRFENTPGGLPHKARQKGWPDLCLLLMCVA